MIPLRDDNPTTTRPVVTIALIALCVIAFLFQGAARETLDDVTAHLSMVPARVSGEEDVILRVPYSRGRAARIELPDAWVPEWLTMLTCIFLHGGWLLLLGNVWILWIFGDNVEERFGRMRYLLLYLGTGGLASLTHFLSEPHSTLPTVGASGAIAGVMGAYLLLYPQARVLTLIPLGFLMHLTVVPAWVFLGIWFALQVVQGLFTLGVDGMGGVAWWAHIGGFVAGIAFAALLRRRDRLQPPPRVLALRGGRYRGSGLR